MHKRIYALIAVVAMTLSALAAHADAISIFTLTNATFQSGATGAGTVTMDTTNGSVIGVDVTYFGATTLGFPILGSQASEPPNNLYNFIATNAAGDEFELAIAVTTGSLVGYAGGDLCSLDTSAECPDPAEPGASFVSVVIPANFIGVDVLQSGSLALTSTETTTPEPSSIALLGTGLIAAVGVFRRKLLHR